MARALLLPLLLGAALTGCRSKNPVGFWDITELSIETPTVDGSRLDAGTIEWTSKREVTVVLRYAILDPATVDQTDAADTGEDAEGPAWMPPISPPLVVTTGEEDNIGEDEAEGFLLVTENGLSAKVGVSEITGASMTLTTDEATLGTESGVSVTITADR